MVLTTYFNIIEDKTMTLQFRYSDATVFTGCVIASTGEHRSTSLPRHVHIRHIRHVLLHECEIHRRPGRYV